MYTIIIPSYNREKLFLKNVLSYGNITNLRQIILIDQTGYDLSSIDEYPYISKKIKVYRNDPLPNTGVLMREAFNKIQHYLPDDEKILFLDDDISISINFSCDLWQETIDDLLSLEDTGLLQFSDGFVNSNRITKIILGATGGGVITTAEKYKLSGMHGDSIAMTDLELVAKYLQLGMVNYLLPFKNINHYAEEGGHNKPWTEMKSNNSIWKLHSLESDLHLKFPDIFYKNSEGLIKTKREFYDKWIQKNLPLVI